jgi:hypothetical protein
MNSEILTYNAPNDNASNDNAAAERSANENIIAITGRRSYRARDIGVGYGRSSGYGLDKRYTTDWGQLRFRCA